MESAKREGEGSWPDAETKAKGAAQARALEEAASKGGLRFEAYLPPALASWLLQHVASGTFCDPSEAVFAIFGEHRDLERHDDLRRELLARALSTAESDSRPPVPGTQSLADLRSELVAAHSKPAKWEPDATSSPDGV